MWNLNMQQTSECNKEEAGLKLNSQINIMASDPVTSWQIDGETMETVTEFIFLGSKSPHMVSAVMKLKDTCSLEGTIDETLLAN